MNNQNGLPVSTLEVPLRWSDMDAFGHVNNSVYFTYFEQARVEWWTAHQLPPLGSDNTFPVIVQASCTYLKPIIYPETINIKVSIAPPGKTSYESFYEVYSKSKPDLLYATGTTKIVWIDGLTGRPTPLPDYLLKLFPKQ